MNKNKMLLELKKAEAAAVKANKKEYALREKFDVLIKGPELLKLVGKTYKYAKNCFSCPEKEEDYWPVYAKVVGMDGTVIKIVEFETDSCGNFNYKHNGWYNGEPGSGWEECSLEEYCKEFAKQLSKVIP